TRLTIIAVTAHAMKGDRERCLQAGMDGYLSKPINKAGLQSIMDEVIRLQPGGVSRPESNIPKSASSESALTLDTGLLLERLGGDEKLLYEVIDIFLE